MTDRVKFMFLSWVRRNWFVFIVGMFAGWLAMAWRPVEGIQLISLSEAQGPQFASKASLEILIDKRQSLSCPSMGQDWIWRWVPQADGSKLRLRKALDNSVVPFGEAGDVSILSVEVPPSVDISLDWNYRRTIDERCEILPSWVPSWFRSWFVTHRSFRTKDVPVTFVGEARK